MSSNVTREDVIAAAKRIDEAVEHTPLIAAQVAGKRAWLKCECLQTGGAFKLRGATNRLLQLSSQERRAGVVAFSSGNHALGVAIAAERQGIAATIVMPADAPAIKIEGTRSHGAEIVFYDRRSESREAIAARLAGEKGAVVVPSFDDPDIVAGQGTVGLEILQQLADLGEPAPPVIVVPVGGGGLASGIALACPEARIVGVEPDGWVICAAHSRSAQSCRSNRMRRQPCARAANARVSALTVGIWRYAMPGRSYRRGSGRGVRWPGA